MLNRTDVMNEKGFTLVELAIVMTIIGLLIGGILKGQAMIENARISGHIAQTQSYTAAIATFRDVNSSLPGDFSNATRRLPGCTAANNCVNGDDSGTIGTSYSGLGWGLTFGGLDEENAQFWKHLALADLISGIDTSNNTTPEFGKTHPTSKYGGGFHIIHYLKDPLTSAVGHVLHTSNSPLITHTWAGATGRSVFSPSVAAKIDRKIDDGGSITGYVQSVSNAWAVCGRTSATMPNGYNETLNTKQCEMAYRMD